MASVSGIGDAIYLDTGDTLTLSGSGHKVTLGGSGDRLTLSGNAEITAKIGYQTLVFTPHVGNATITGLDATDTLQFSVSQFSDWHSLLAHASQRGTDTVIQTDASHNITLVGVTLATLGRNHVTFA